MKRSRIGIKKRQRKINMGIALFFLVILPITAVAIGLRITEWLVIPTINTEELLKPPMDFGLETEGTEEGNIVEETPETSKNEDEEEVYTETANLNSLSVYMIQIASVSDNKNIEPLVEQLSNNEFPHIIYKMDNAYKVYTFGATQREYIEDKLEIVREVYPDAYIGQMHIYPKEISYKNEENDGTKEIVNSMNLLIDILGESSKIVYQSINEEDGLNNYREILGKHQELLGQISEKTNNANLSKEFYNKDDILKMIEHQKKNISESFKTIDEDQDLYKLQNYFIDSLFRTIEVTKKQLK